MKKLLLIIVLLAGCSTGDRIDNRVFNCSVAVTIQAIPIEEFNTRVSEGENLSVSSFETVDNEQVANIFVCSEERSDDDTATTTTSATANIE